MNLYDTAEIFTYSQFNVLFKGINDLFIFVLGDYEENELVNDNKLIFSN